METAKVDWEGWLEGGEEYRRTLNQRMHPAVLPRMWFLHTPNQVLLLAQTFCGPWVVVIPKGPDLVIHPTAALKLHVRRDHHLAPQGPQC
jgi:hypothetical protein